MTLVKPCAHCQTVFKKDGRLSATQWGSRLYCSQACSGLAATLANAAGRPSIRAKFESNFVRTDGCWEWKGTIDGYGYGVMDHNRKRYRAHVLALEFDGRPVPEGMQGCHDCDNRKCVRPSHLYPGTPKDNYQDAVSRNRNTKGEKHGHARLTESDVKAMRMTSGLSFAEIGRRFGVSRPTAARVVKGTSWRHVR